MKHLVPTTSPERIWMELDCLRVANGKENVIPLLFGHRLDGDVILAMPFIHTIRFGELIKDITMSEAKWVTNTTRVGEEVLICIQIYERAVSSVSLDTQDTFSLYKNA